MTEVQKLAVWENTSTMPEDSKTWIDSRNLKTRTNH